MSTEPNQLPEDYTQITDVVKFFLYLSLCIYRRIVARKDEFRFKILRGISENFKDPFRNVPVERFRALDDKRQTHARSKFF